MHQPVLKNEVLEFLQPEPGKNFIDGTFGFGGHALEILKRIKPDGRVLGIERDEEVLKKQPSVQGLILKQGNFSNLKEIVQKEKFSPVDGVLLDLGLSSWQIGESGKGFSFLKEEPLIMRVDSEGITAQEIVNSWPEQKLEKILKEYGEERYARRIAQSICQKRKLERIKTTSQLVKIIRQAVPAGYGRRRINPATKTFQALRIAVNDELGNLEKVLPQALKILNTKGRLAIIAFHSLEDRIVKNYFRQEAKQGQLEILTKKPIRPSLEEVRTNPRSRSAKLRVALKL